MGYQALLFCPEEKTARTVTQVLGELEFSVQTCAEPFAAVKKLMAEHFDAIVVDCDNEQNATLVFKSARNSSSNQTALAVAVVEGQAGVAKAFRIGANLVLTKPINVEQAKGTLRVARGLLRKGEPVKPAAAPAAEAAPVASPAAEKITSTSGSKSAAAPKSAWPMSVPDAVMTRPASLPPVPVSSATVSAKAQTADDDVLEIAEPAAKAAAPSSARSGRESGSKDSTRSVAGSMGFRSSPSSGAASAAAPARSFEEPDILEVPGTQTADSVQEAAKKKNEEKGTATIAVGAPTFALSDGSTESSGGGKKALIGIVAAAIVAAGLYFGWTQFHGRTGSQESNGSSSETAPAEQSKAAGAASSAVTPAASPTTSATSAAPAPAVVNAMKGPDENQPTAKGEGESSGKKPAKSSKSTPEEDDSAAEAKPAEQPMLVQKGSKPKSHTNVPDAAPPSVDFTPSASGGSLGNLVGNSASAPAPVLSALNISQGVSQGLLIKKVSPVYPASAMRMHLEGSVQLMATISKMGNIASVKSISGDPVLAQAAMDAVKQWKYRPYLLNGEPVEIQTQITVNFKLPK